MDWRRTLSQLHAERSADDHAPDLRPGVSATEVVAAEQRLGVRFPASLRSLLHETNGVMERMRVGGVVEDTQWLFWPVDQLVEENEHHRARAAQPDYGGRAHAVLFFANVGADGILFGFPVTENGECLPHVVVWHPIDTLTEVAPTLEAFRRWLNGEVSV